MSDAKLASHIPGRDDAPEDALAAQAVTWRTILRNLTRLISPLDIISQVGNLIYRRSLRYTLFTLGVGLLGLVAARFDLPGLTLQQAILLPLCVGLAALVGGGLLRLLPCLISYRLVTVAQANDLDLMEDHRKSLVGQHLEFLWDRVFRHEMRLRLIAGLPLFRGFEARGGEDTDQALTRAQPLFLQAAAQALDALLPQVSQMHEYGLDLRYLEDWRDGACLDPSDTKLAEQFDGHATLLAVRHEVGLRGMAMWRFAPRLSAQKLWFAIITRSVGYHVGSAIETLNTRYDTDLFNAQVLLWPGEENAAWLAPFEHARFEILRLRRQVIRKVFGPNQNSAREVIDHMFYGCFGLATELRLRYDPEYCLGEIGCEVLLDLLAEGRNPTDFRRARLRVASAEQDRSLLHWLTATHRPDLKADAQAEGFRALRVALHVNRDRLRDRLRAARDAGGPIPPATLDAIDQVLADRQRVSRRLLAVRMHHELTRLARQSYRQLVFQLGYNET